MKPSELTLLDSERGAFAFCAWQNIVIIVWPGQATGRAVEHLAAVTVRMIEAYPEGISNIHIVPRGALLPTSKARSGFVGIMERHAKQLACVAVVLEGTGFWAATLRSVITGMRMVSPRNFSMRFHERIEEVPLWLPKQHQKLTGVALDAKELLLALIKSRNHLDEHKLAAAR